MKFEHVPDSTKEYIDASAILNDVKRQIEAVNRRFEEWRQGIPPVEHDLRVLEAARDRSREKNGAEHPETKYYEGLIEKGRSSLAASDEIIARTRGILDQLDAVREENERLLKKLLN